MDLNLNNVFILRDLIVLGDGEIKGRKKLQKIIYAVQQLANPFNPPFEFKWNFYGVYSDELTGELGVGRFFGILKEKPIKEYGYTTYTIRAVDRTEVTAIAGDEKLRKIMQFLNSKEPRLLEVLTSIIFFESEGLEEKEINKNLIAYKGHLQDFFDEAKIAYEELKLLAN